MLLKLIGTFSEGYMIKPRYLYIDSPSLTLDILRNNKTNTKRNYYINIYYIRWHRHGQIYASTKLN